jgi:nicotinate-nucleotide adenylyltransferase
MRIGLFGGSFNPIHVGHISLAKQLKELAGLDEVWLVVSPQNPLKQSDDLLDDRLRFEMARQALEGETDIKACDYELHLPKPSYTWNTLQHLKEDYPQHTFVLLIGGDNWQRFPMWYRSEDIVNDYPIVVYPRRGCETDCKQLPPNVMMADTELLDISSTEIRERIQQGESISGMVPNNIEELVRRNYRSER